MSGARVQRHEGSEGHGRVEGTPRTRLQSLLHVSSMDRIQRYQPPTDRPTIRGVLEGRRAGADGRGIPRAGLPRRLLQSAYRGEDRVAARRQARAREMEPWRGEEQQR